MRRSPVLCFLAVLMILMSGCSAGNLLSRFFPAELPQETGGTLIYRLSADLTDGSELIRTESFPMDAESVDPGQVITLFLTPPADTETLSCALPATVSVQGWHLENGVLTITFSPSFLEEPEMTRTIAAMCAALTLCQLDEIDAVTVLCDGQTLYTGLMPADAFLGETESDPYTRQLRLYFPDSAGRWLISEYHSLTLDEDTSPERYVVEELLHGPNNGELRSVIPDGTILRSCSTGEDGVCTVDLSAEFYDTSACTPVGERLILYAVVNSLTALPGVDSVRFLREGQPVSTYLFRSLAEPLERYDAAVGPVSAPKGELDADLCLVLPDMQSITPLPFRVSVTDFASHAEAVLSALLGAAEPGYPVLFSGSGSVIDVTVQGSVGIVDLSESFFASLPKDARGTAVQSVAATLCSLPEIGAVRFTVGGQPAVFDGEDWSGPWRDFSEIEVK